MAYFIFIRCNLQCISYMFVSQCCNRLVKSSSKKSILLKLNKDSVKLRWLIIAD